MIKWSLKELDISKLTPYHKNPRYLTKHDKEHLETSLDKFGLVSKPIVNTDDHNTIIAGHQRINLLKKQGVKKIECWIPSVTLSDKDVEEFNMRHNKNNGNFDHDTLADKYDINDLFNWGWTEDEIKVKKEDKDPILELNTNITEQGDVYLLKSANGLEHQLICDSLENIDTTIFNATPSIVFSKVPTKYINKLPSLLAAVDQDSFLVLIGSIKDLQVYNELNMPVFQTIVWNKVKPEQVLEGLGNQYELMYVFKNGHVDMIGSSGNVWNAQPQGANYGVPEKLIKKALRFFSSKNDTVLDVFAQTGSTIVASEQAVRNSVSIIDKPKNADVAIRRWLDYINEKGYDFDIEKNGQELNQEQILAFFDDSKQEVAF